MPLYDFKCPACGETFEVRAAVDEAPACPGCGQPGAVRQVSGFAGPFTVGLRGAAARRSDSVRRAREESRRERREQRNEQRKQNPPGD